MNSNDHNLHDPYDQQVAYWGPSRPGRGSRRSAHSRWAEQITATHVDAHGWGWRARRRRAQMLTAINAYHQAVTRIATRERQDLSRRGWHFGPVPYGYQLAPAPTPLAGPGRGRVGKVLDPEPDTAHVIGRVFGWRIHDELGYTAIAHRLNASPDRFPPPAGRGGEPRSFTGDMVRRILDNPRYTGRQVIRRHATTPWLMSPPVHPALVTDLQFWQAQQLSPRPIPWPLADPTHTQHRAPPSLWTPEPGGHPDSAGPRARYASGPPWWARP